MKNVSTDVTPKPCNHQAILILASFTRHFDSHAKKETRRNKSQIAKCKILTDSQNMKDVKNVWKQKHFALNGESSVIEVLRKNFSQKPCFL